MKALLFLALFGFSNFASATPSPDSTVTVTPNSAYPDSVVNIIIFGLAAEDAFNAIVRPAGDSAVGSSVEIRQSGQTVCERRIVKDDIRQASVVKFQCVVYVRTKGQ